MRKFILIAAIAALAVLWALPASGVVGHTLTVDGTVYLPSQISGPTVHYETPDTNPQSAFTERNTWTGNGSEHLPCEFGIHWIDNHNVLTVSHCLEGENGTTTTTTSTSTTTTTEPTTTTTTTEPTTTTTTTEPTTTTTTSTSTTTTEPSTTTTEATTTTTTEATTTTASKDPCIDSNGDGIKTWDEDGDGVEDDPNSEPCELVNTGANDTKFIAGLGAGLALLGGAFLLATRPRPRPIRVRLPKLLRFND